MLTNKVYMSVKNLAYTQVLEETLLKAIYQNPDDRLKMIDEARVRAKAQANVLYQYIFENYGDVGLEGLLDDI